MNEQKIKSCFIRPLDSKLFIQLINGQTIEIDINNNNNTDKEETQQLIYNAHIVLRQHQYQHRNSTQTILDGCFPSRFLIHVPEPSVNINTRYLINLFIEHMALLFSDHTTNAALLFERDDRTIPIPICDDDMSKLYDKMIEGLLATDAISNNNNDDDDGSSSGDINNVQLLMKMVLQYLLGVQSEGEKNLSDKNLKKMKKSSSIVGGVNQKELFEHLGDKNNNLMNKEDVTKNLRDSTQSIKNFIRENKEMIKSKIYENNNLESAFRKILDIMKGDDRTPIYVQYAISFDLMLEFIGEVLNVALYDFIPQTSFILSLQAVFYNAAYLYQLNILEKYTDIIFLPVLHRLTYSCFPSSLVVNEKQRYIEDIKKRYGDIVHTVTHTLKNDASKNIAELAKIALKVDMKDESFMNGLFWLLNDERGFTFEYYLILLAHLFSNTNKCKNLNKQNKISNIKQFLEPLYIIIGLYKEYVQLVPKDSVLSSQTLENFNKLYSSQISQAIAHFSGHLLAK